jgi:hypothetical protein
MQPQTQRIAGTVARALISPGSKSEHRGVVLRTARGDEFILRRAGGNAFRDETLEALVGTTITGTGIVVGQTFIVQDWTKSK